MTDQNSAPFDSPSDAVNKAAPPGLSLSAILEALLFAAPGSVTSAQLAAALEISVREIDKGLADLEAQFKGRGLRLQRHFGRVQLTTAPETASFVEKFLGLEASSHLSRAALETLAIIAYQQPVTRPEIDAIRGVNSDGVLKSLLSKGLVQEVGRAERPGRPILYSTTPDFLGHFGLNSLEELPPLNPPEQPESQAVESDFLKGN
jgi:segregation and condensation protein B